MAGVGKGKGVSTVMPEHDLELEEAFPTLKQSPYQITSPTDPKYNCIAFAVGDLTHYWDDVGFRGYSVKGYYWPSGVPSSSTLIGWTTIFEIHGYEETNDRSLEPEYEKIAIYVRLETPEHVARQKESGIWTSKLGKGVDIEHTLEGLEGELYGKVTRIMRRKCQDGKRVLE